MILSKKQINLFNDIVSPNIPNLSVLGSTQSGKTYDICGALIQYAQVLRDYEKEQRKNPEYIRRNYYGAIIGWTTDTLNGNIVENLKDILENEYHLKKDKDYVLKFGNNEKYLKIYDIKFFFFGFNTYLAFNKILGKPLIFVWVDEAARIYTSSQLRETFDEIPGRQMSYAGHPYYKRIDSFNVEGGENHPYKKNYIDGKDWKQYVFYPYDNPVLDTPEKIKAAVNTFPKGSLRDQKVYNLWKVAEGKVFNNIKVIQQEEINNYIIREIGIGCDYGSVNATTFCGIALAQNIHTRRWELLLIDSYYHDPKVEGDTPTTEYYSRQIKMFITYLQKKYVGIKVNTLVIDSEAAHFDNRLTVDGIRHELAKKNTLTVDKSVQLMQSLFYKELLKKVNIPPIRYFTPNGEPVYAGHDIALEELETYHYDKLKSEREGINCYVKEFDHYVDGTRYIIMEYSLTGRCPIV